MENQDNVKNVKLPETDALIVSSSPHIHENAGIAKIMKQVVLCLLPCVVSALWFFRWHAVTVLVSCVAFSMLFEYLWTRMMKTKNTLGDWSAAVTGLILALNISPASPWWICAIGSFIAIIIGKEVFGGLGQNPFNPAAVGRVALLVGFTGPMTTWLAPYGATLSGVDGMTQATPLAMVSHYAGNPEAVKALENANHLQSYFFGSIGGSLGETSALAILLGAVGLLAFRLIRWQIPLAILGTVAVFTWIAHVAAPGLTPGPLFHLLTGGLMIGAFFMATDMVTSPVTIRGCILFGVGIGLITCVIRIWGSYPEGVSFAILIMNALVPLIDKICYSRPFGWMPGFGGAK